MSRRIIISVLFFVSLFLLSTVSRSQTNPAYLSQFPASAHISSDQKGKDAMDTAARQMGACWQMQQLIYKLAWQTQKRGRGRLTPDESRIANDYNNGYAIAAAPYANIQNTPAHPDRPKWYELHSFYETDPGFLDELMRRYFTVEFRNDFYRLTGKRPPEAGSSQPVNGPKSSTASAAGEPDTSIAKAKAAKVDLTIVGLQFGEPLSVAVCPLIMIGPPKQTCRAEVPAFAAEIVAGLGIKSTTPEDMTIVTLDENHCPSWVTQCQAYVTVKAGGIAAVGLFTEGRNSAKTVTTDLTSKYGKPTLVKNGVVTPDTGNPFNISEPEWNLPGLHVEYEIVARDDNGERIHTNQGIVRIMTEGEYQRRLAEKKKPVKTKL
ncbi:MAG: hypothetical protein ACRD6X_08835 [Pyrinomonadaceae bacterium]